MPSESTCSQHRAYLCIKEMTVNRANAMPSPYIAGLPSMYGVVGMAKHLIDQVLKGSGMVFDSVAISISRFKMSDSQQKYPSQSVEDIHGKKFVRIISARDSFFKASVFIRVNLDTQELSEVQRWLNAQRHRDGLYRLRLCGGHIFYESGAPELRLLTESELSMLCNHIDGFVIADRISLCRSLRKQDEDSLDCLLRLIQERKNMHNGWLVPLSVGYISISDHQHRVNTRQNLLHGFAESVTGLGRLFNTRSTASLLGKSDHFFWKPHPERDFLVAGSI